MSQTLYTRQHTNYSSPTQDLTHPTAAARILYIGAAQSLRSVLLEQHNMGLTLIVHKPAGPWLHAGSMLEQGPCYSNLAPFQ